MNVMISTSEYQNSKLEGSSVTNKDTHYYSYEDIPLDEWETGQKNRRISNNFSWRVFWIKNGL